MLAKTKSLDKVSFPVIAQPKYNGVRARLMVVEDAGDETRRPRICRRPLAPTKEMVEEHNRTNSCGISRLVPGLPGWQVDWVAPQEGRSRRGKIGCDHQYRLRLQTQGGAGGRYHTHTRGV